MKGTGRQVEQILVTEAGAAGFLGLYYSEGTGSQVSRS